MSAWVRNTKVSLTRGGVVACCWVVLFSCEAPDNALYLPPGDAERGLKAFQALACTSCHVVSEFSIERPTPDPAIYVILGGQTTQIKNYPELVTSIINPDHRLSRGSDIRTVTPRGESRMKAYNEIMSVQQLIDIVEFLKPTYYVWSPDTVSSQFPEN